MNVCFQNAGVLLAVVFTVVAADLSPASVDDPDVFLSVSRKCYLFVSAVQILHRCLLGRKLLHMCLTHTDTQASHTG